MRTKVKNDPFKDLRMVTLHFGDTGRLDINIPKQKARRRNATPLEASRQPTKALPAVAIEETVFSKNFRADAKRFKLITNSLGDQKLASRTIKFLEDEKNVSTYADLLELKYSDLVGNKYFGEKQVSLVMRMIECVEKESMKATAPVVEPVN